MQSKFRNFRIGEIATVIGGGTPSTSDPDNYGGNIPWITPKDLSNHKSRYISHGERSITNKGLKNSSAKLLPKKTILFSSRAPIGYIAIAKTEVTTNQGFKSLILNDEHHPEFFYYLLKTYTPLIESYATGSTFKEISGGALQNIEVSIPTLNIQKVIAHILGSLDDKIELNQKMNQTLEDIAKAIFKSWFVDFDPVRAKVVGKPTGLPDEISHLFPDELFDSELGEIPKGWILNPLDAIGTFRNGLALQKFPAVEGDKSLPVIKIAQLRKGNAIGDDLYASGVPKEYIINDGDFIFSWSGSLLAKYWIGGQGALNQHLFKVESKTMPLWFVAKWVEHYLPRFQAIAEDKATTMGHIKREHLREALCIVPSNLLIDAAEKIISPIIEKIILNEVENKLLVQLRETLLPKLISGELEIPDAEKFLEEAGI